MSYKILRNLLFKFEPETAHSITMRGLKLASIFYHQSVPKLPHTVMGIEFPNPVGLAAGFDKNGEYVDALASLGFGFIEIGTVTPKPQPGNPKPRLFRLPKVEALINRMAFNSKGVDYLIQQVKQAKYSGVLGINIGKNLNTPLDRAAEDYLIGMQKVYPYADFITVNISSPNTPGLRELQFHENLHALLTALKLEQAKLKKQHSKHVPLVIKIAPDLTDTDVKDIAQAALQHNIEGIIATNATIARDKVHGIKHAEEQGGLSGKPLFEQSLHIVETLHSAVGNKIPIIALGGIMSGANAHKMLTAGASLVQIYTGFIYQGPALIKEIVAY